MHYKYIDYCEEYADEIELWATDPNTHRFVTSDTFDETIKSLHNFYMKTAEHKHASHNYKWNETYFCKVVLDGDIVIAYLSLVKDDPDEITINQIIINPKHRHKGHGTKILIEIIGNSKNIFLDDSRIFVSSIDIDNTASMKLFEKSGFVLAGVQKEDEFGDFTHWVYPASELDSNRKGLAKVLGEEFIATSAIC